MFADRQFEAYQSFLLGCKLYWTGPIYAELRATYARKAALAAAVPRSAGEAAALLEGETLHETYAWLERHLQRFKYSGRWGLQPAHEARRTALEATLDAKLPDGLLALDPELEMPKYYAGTDIHQHPGGVWSDALAGLVYERGARTTTPLLTRHKDLHDRFADLVRARGPWRRLADLGCGFGKSTRPFAAAARDAEVVGVDLSAPCLRLAARDAASAQARNLRFRQADARATGLAGAAFDVVTSTMLIHEMPPPAIRALFAESHRLLAPGGLAAHLDFRPPADDPFLAAIHYGHARRNNEPFMEKWARMDAVAELEAAGFRDVEIAPFEEADGAIAASDSRWRFPWVAIFARKAA